MSKYWSNTIRALEPYTPGEQPQDQQYIKLNTNESPYPPSPKVIRAIKEAANDTLRLYPDPGCEALRKAIAGCYGLTPEHVFVGNGSDEVLMLVFLTFFQQDQPILFPDVTYSFYQVYCDFLRIQASTIPVTADFRIRLADYTRPNGGIIFANPNAMTGRCVAAQDIETVLMNNKESVVAIDEAYVDFGGESAISFINTYPNLLIIQTLSKSRALAGLRIGFALGNQELIEGLERAKNSFNSYTLDRIAIAGGVAAMQDDAYFRDVCRKIINTREWLTAELRQLEVDVVPSQANFIFMQHPRVSGKHLYGALRKQGILVRYFDKPRVSRHIRVSIGTDAEMQIFVEKLREIFSEDSSVFQTMV